MSERKERVVRRRFLALLLLLVLLGIALFLIAIASISGANAGPPLTQITSAPSDPSGSRTAAFSYTNILEVSRFECSLDGSPFTTCGSERPSSTTYTGLAEGRHAFRVRAVADGITGAARSYEWTIDLTSSSPPGGGGRDDGSSDRPAPPPGSGDSDSERPDTPPPPGEDDGDGTGGGGETPGGGGEQPSPRGFLISGSTAPGDLLYPGAAAVPIPLTIRNPRAAVIRVVGLAVAIDAERLPPGCLASWFRVNQSNASSSRRLVVPALAFVSLPAQGVSAPTIRMLDSGNQDACKRATIHLLYTGSARS